MVICLYLNYEIAKCSVIIIANDNVQLDSDRFSKQLHFHNNQHTISAYRRTNQLQSLLPHDDTGQLWGYPPGKFLYIEEQ